jgi:hypothetical protein
MMQDEHEDYGDESRDIIAGLRHLAQQSQAPPELLATIMARGQQLLPRQRVARTWWQRLLSPWQIRPLVWGPVIALVGFMAGVLVPLPHLDRLLDSPVPEKAQKVAEEPPLRSTELPAPAPPPASLRELRSAAPVTKDEAESRAPVPASPAPRAVGEVVEVTITLPAALYEQLVHQATRHHTDISTVLREAIEGYVERGK